MVSEKTIQFGHVWTIVLSRLEHVAHGYFPMLSHHFNSHFPWPSLAIFWAYQFSGTPILQSAEVFPHVETQ
jgi:hypothetical protein